MADNVLLRCKHCSTIYRITGIVDEDDDTFLVTDYEDKLETSYQDNKLYCECLCGHSIPVEGNAMLTEDWIANLVFKVKGES